MDGLTRLNQLPEPEAAHALGACCGARRWVAAMLARRPFRAPGELGDAAAAIWRGLGPDDWKEAFAHHPRIGEGSGPHPSPQTSRGDAWSAAEQALVSEADSALRNDLARINRDYEARFGYIYVVRATGRSPRELLELARARLGNDPATELRVAADEQLAITLLRLNKLIA